MPVILIVLLIIAAVVIFIGIPTGVMGKAYVNKKRGEGNYVMAIVVDKTCTNARVALLPKDKNTIIDRYKTPEGGEKERVYTVVPGVCPSVMWPPFQSKFFQASVPMAILVEGVSKAVDPVGQNREGTALAGWDNAEIVGNMRREKITDVLVKDLDQLSAMIESLQKGVKSISPALFFIGIAVVIVCLVITVLLLRGQIGSMSSQIKDLADALIGAQTGG